MNYKIYNKENKLVFEGDETEIKILKITEAIDETYKIIKVGD